MSAQKGLLFDALEQQAGMVHDVASALAHLTTHPATPSDAEAVLARVEANAGSASQQIELILAKSFTLEIDREDLLELSNALRSVLVLVVRAVRTALSVGTRASESMHRLADMIVQTSASVARAVEHFRTYDYAFIAGVARELRTLHRLARQAYDEAVVALLGSHEALGNRGLLRDNLILENLKQIIQGSREVATLLSYVAVKNT